MLVVSSTRRLALRLGPASRSVASIHTSRPVLEEQDKLSPHLKEQWVKGFTGMDQTVSTTLSGEDAKNPLKVLYNKFTDRFQVGKEFEDYLPIHSDPKDRVPQGSLADINLPHSSPDLEYKISFFDRSERTMTKYSELDEWNDFCPNGVPRHVDRPAWVEDPRDIAFMKDHWHKCNVPLPGICRADDTDFAYINPDVYHVQDHGNLLWKDLEDQAEVERLQKQRSDELKYETWDEWVYGEKGVAKRKEMAAHYAPKP
eukprot:gb/GEZN01017188.1/.p1 GENE.gb/GEZN01017188.1/~~gb/GEZN01017188.1/.p1  ORF type:complete len:257 (+),score=31.51 gb/GEZN01017188.1/:32-802(+)